MANPCERRVRHSHGVREKTNPAAQLPADVVQLPRPLRHLPVKLRLGRRRVREGSLMRRTEDRGSSTKEGTGGGVEKEKVEEGKKGEG